jgi:hypothetical protein
MYDKVHKDIEGRIQKDDLYKYLCEIYKVK